jgi:hypothetical protein
MGSNYHFATTYSQKAKFLPNQHYINSGKKNLHFYGQYGYSYPSYSSYTPYSSFPRYVNPSKYQRNIYPPHGNQTRPNQYGNRTSRKISIGKQIFLALRDYGNNYYSILLAKRDLDFHRSSPHYEKEVQRVLDSLTKPQIRITDMAILEPIQKRLRETAQELVRINMEASLSSYLQRSKEIKLNLTNLLTSEVKHVPSGKNVFRYIRPQLSTRRFSEIILPSLEKNLIDIVDLLKIQIQHNCTGSSTNTDDNTINMETSTNVSTIIINEQLEQQQQPNFNVEVSNTQSIVLQEDISMVVQNEFSRKRKQDGPIDVNLSEDEITDEITNNEAGSSKPSSSSNSMVKSKRVTIDETNIVKNIDELYSEYETFIPGDCTTPSFSHPPESPQIVRLPTGNTEELIHACRDVDMSSMGKYSLITLYTEDGHQLPPSHLAIKINKEDFINKRLENIPTNHHFFYELLLIGKSGRDYVDFYKYFAEWAKTRAAGFYITVAMQHRDKVRAKLYDWELLEIRRPFHANASAFTTG